MLLRRPHTSVVHLKVLQIRFKSGTRSRWTSDGPIHARHRSIGVNGKRHVVSEPTATLRVMAHHHRLHLDCTTLAVVLPRVNRSTGRDYAPDGHVQERATETANTTTIDNAWSFVCTIDLIVLVVFETWADGAREEICKWSGGSCFAGFL